MISSCSAVFVGKAVSRNNAEEWPCFSVFFIGHTSSSPTAYSPSHTETNSSGVPLFRTSVRTWFLLHSMLESFVMLRPQGHLWDVERRHDLHRSLWLSRALCTDHENVTIHIVWRTSVNSGLCVCGYLCLINMVCMFEGLPCRQIAPAALYYITINRPLVLEGELCSWNLTHFGRSHYSAVVMRRTCGFSSVNYRFLAHFITLDLILN